MIEQLGDFALVLLAISLASERLVVVAKTLVARLQNPMEQRLRSGHADVPSLTDKPRRLWVLAASFLAAYLTAAFLAQGVEDLRTYWSEGLLGGKVRIGQRPWPVWIVALMASGGSAFWAQVVAYASALKDVRQAQVTSGASVTPPTTSEGRMEEMSWADIKGAANLNKGGGSV